MHVFSILTLFPEIIYNSLNYSIIGRAVEEEIIDLRCHNIRDNAINDYGQVDDKLYGGGRGMLMMVEPIVKTWLSLYLDNPESFLKKLPDQMSLGEWHETVKSVSQDKVIYLSPKGKVFNQDMAKELSEEDHLVFLCGHYEGVDQRALDILNVQEISLGDFVLTGGEPAVVVMIDAISRMIPGVLADEEAYLLDSHASGLLEEPQYTRPSNWKGVKVPEILLSGHQMKIDCYRKTESLRETLEKRPDLLQKKRISKEEWIKLIDSRQNN